ncbi:NAD(P)-binding protein [Thelephora ganbajun]|uniref:NAD(P)-binding protein n=1 Tax=Thelephora ganbajun TaxID=370292 RepID=A0ACB6ZDT9_THEGA|nr:NAD(P)-binding protein [Thelephora ganbajun]
MISTQKRTLPCFSMQDKVCLVTGGARGLGLEFARAFVISGCTQLVILDLKQAEADSAAKELLDSARENGIDLTGLDLIGIECDVASEESVKIAFDQTRKRFGRVDAVVASAGIVENYPALEYPFDRARKLFDINVHGAYLTAREAAKVMIPNGGGSIVLVASMSASIVNVPQPQTPYNASKAAVKHMATSLAIEWAKTGVRRHNSSPGYTLTKLTKTILAGKPELKETWERLTPIGRLAEPEDLAGAVVFLASDASKFMTGTDLLIDGGYCAI